MSHLILSKGSTSIRYRITHKVSLECNSSPISLVPRSENHVWHIVGIQQMVNMSGHIIGSRDQKILSYCVASSKSSLEHQPQHSSGHNTTVILHFMCQFGSVIVLKYLVKHYSGYFCEVVFWMRLMLKSVDFE